MSGMLFIPDEIVLAFLGFSDNEYVQGIILI